MADEELLLLPQVPAPRADDPEDVSWALSTAEAMWGRGEHAEGLKWVRKAAEAASDAENDLRALELAKVASDLSTAIARGSFPALASAPEVMLHAPTVEIALPVQGAIAAPLQPRPSPAPAPAIAVRLSPPPAPAVTPLAPPVTTSGLGPQAPVKPAARSTSAPPIPPQAGANGPFSPSSPSASARPAPPLPPGSQPPPRGSSAPRPFVGASNLSSRPPRYDGKQDELSSKRLIDVDDDPRGVFGDDTPSPVPVPVPLDRTAPRRTLDATARSPKFEIPAREPVRDRDRAEADPTVVGHVKDFIAAAGRSARTESSAAQWDASPTQSLSSFEMDALSREGSSDGSNDGDRMTSLGVAPVALAALEGRAAPPRVAAPAVTERANRHDPGIQTSQAVRVVVWRDSNGVHVAPAGTVVSAITVDAVLVALEPNADLTAWLSQRDR